jgi:hypothetical protein
LFDEKIEESAIASAEHRPRPICDSVWLSPEGASFAAFIYDKAAERLLRHFTGTDENEVIRQARVWCDENS